MFNSQSTLLYWLRLERHSPDDPPGYLELIKIFLAYFRELGRAWPFVFEWLTWWIVLLVLRSFKINQISLALQLEWFFSVRQYTRFLLASFCFIIFKVLLLLYISAVIFLGLKDVITDRTLSCTDFLSLGTCMVWSWPGLIIFIVPVVTNNSGC